MIKRVIEDAAELCKCVKRLDDAFYNNKVTRSEYIEILNNSMAEREACLAAIEEYKAKAESSEYKAAEEVYARCEINGVKLKLIKGDYWTCSGCYLDGTETPPTKCHKVTGFYCVDNIWVEDK